MSNRITDRELLAFCSLAKLKLEFSQYKKVILNDDKSITEEYKTPRQLIDEELEGQKKRVQNNLYQVEEDMAEQRQENIKNEEELKRLMGLSSNDTDAATMEEISRLKEKIKKHRKEEKEHRDRNLERIKEGGIGQFYRVYKRGEIKFFYETEEDLKLEAPMLMEYYDTYYTGNPDSKFLDEWKIVFAGDDYNLSVDLYNKFISDVQNKELLTGLSFWDGDIIKKEEDVYRIPHRDDVEVTQNRMITKKIKTSFADLAMNIIK